jgi:tellurium resistance protein TerD
MTSSSSAAVPGQISILHKGEEVILNKIDGSLRRVFVGVGWDAPNENDGFPVDIDLTAFVLKNDGRVRRDTDFIFYNNLESEEKSVKHRGDNISGDGDGDDEVVEIDLDTVPFEADKIAFVVTIHNAEERQQTFGLIKSAFIRIVNLDTGVELAHYDLTEDASADNGIIFGELVRDIDGWKFKAIGEGSKGGLYKIAKGYGVNVAAP